MRWKIDDIPAFVAAVDHSGITAAAQRLDLPKSTVSKAISRLEAALGTRLLERGSRSVRATAEGEVFYRRCLAILDQVRETDAAMSGLVAKPSGRIVVALPAAFCQEVLSPRLGDFVNAYPEVDVELVVTSRPVDLVRDEVDIAIVVGVLDDSELVVRRLLGGRLVWISTPEYLRHNPVGDTVETLRPHVRICEKRYGSRRFPVTVDGRHGWIDLGRPMHHVNDPLSVRAAVLAGCGVSLLPERYCAEQLANGELVEICRNVQFDHSAATLSAVYPGRKLLSARSRVFLDFLQEICRSERRSAANKTPPSILESGGR